jgi:hypothetical protein
LQVAQTQPQISSLIAILAFIIKMPAIAANKDISLSKAKMHKRGQIMHVHAQIMHFFPHEKMAYAFLSVGGQPSKGVDRV